MKAKSFYIARSAQLHAQKEQAMAQVASIEAEIDENIRLINVAPLVDDPEPFVPPVPKAVEAPPVVKPAAKVASKKV